MQLNKRATLTWEDFRWDNPYFKYKQCAHCGVFFLPNDKFAYPPGVQVSGDVDIVDFVSDDVTGNSGLVSHGICPRCFMETMQRELGVPPDEAVKMLEPPYSNKQPEEISNFYMQDGSNVNVRNAQYGEYIKKRNFTKTPEPKPNNDNDKSNIFVIQKHEADKAGLHYDFRMNINGVGKSWVIRKNVPTKVGEKRLAISVENHPISYFDFEGTIPEGQYGAGEVSIYDKGTYEMLEDKKDRMTFRLNGNKVKGLYHMVKTDDNKWLIIRGKERSEKKANNDAELLKCINNRMSAIKFKALPNISPAEYGNGAYMWMRHYTTASEGFISNCTPRQIFAVAMRYWDKFLEYRDICKKQQAKQLTLPGMEASAIAVGCAKVADSLDKMGMHKSAQVIRDMESLLLSTSEELSKEALASFLRDAEVIKGKINILKTLVTGAGLDAESVEAIRGEMVDIINQLRSLYTKIYSAYQSIFLTDDIVPQEEVD